MLERIANVVISLNCTTIVFLNELLNDASSYTDDEREGVKKLNFLMMGVYIESNNYLKKAFYYGDSNKAVKDEFLNKINYRMKQIHKLAQEHKGDKNYNNINSYCNEYYKAIKPLTSKLDRIY